MYEPYGRGSPAAGSGGPTQRSGTTRAKHALILMACWVALLWALELVDRARDHQLDSYGIQPRSAAELRDIVPAAFMHFGFEHLAANTVPLLVLGFVAALRGVPRFAGVVTMIILVSGFGVWLFAADGSNTAGASGVVFGLFGYLLVRGFVDKKATDILIGVAVLAVYGSILVGVVPTDGAVSWQGHLFGLVGGVMAAYYFSDRKLGAARS